MGTSIDILFPREITTPEEITLGLDAAFHKCSEQLEVISRNAWYRIDFDPWKVVICPEYDGEPAYLFDEGPHGFSVHVYDKVLLLGSLERFGRLYSQDSPVAGSLQIVVETVVRTLTKRPVFAAGAGGMGDSDAAIDLAYYGQAPLSKVCDALFKSNGPPARSWNALSADENRWCLIDLPPQPS